MTVAADCRSVAEPEDSSGERTESWRRRVDVRAASPSFTYRIEQDTTTREFFDLATALTAFDDQPLDIGELANFDLGDNQLLDFSVGIEFGAADPHLGFGFDFVLGNGTLTATQAVPLSGCG